MIKYKNLDKYICDKVYQVETKEYGIYKGYLLNYNYGNLVLLTISGVVHLRYKDITFMAPCRPSEKLQKIINDITQEKQITWNFKAKNDDVLEWRCSECGHVIFGSPTNYCANCGTDMKNNS